MKPLQSYQSLILRLPVFLVIQLVLLSGVAAQDLNFSQYFNAPLVVNPANTGFNPDYDYRVGGNYRNQWASVGNPYKTMGLWGDTKLFANRFENGWMGLGGSILKDVAGSGSLTSTSGYLSLAYHQMLGYKSLLSAGFSAGFVTKRIDLSKLDFDNQWNGKFFDITLPSNEPFTYSQTSYLDLQMGLNYALFASENAYFNAGISIMHLNKPLETFFSPAVSDNKVDMRYSFFANASIKVQDIWIVNPNIYYSRMGNASEVVLGFNANRDLSGDGMQQLILGIYYRNKDAAIPVVGYQIKDLKITVNYDATISSLKNLNGTRGAYELSIVKHGIFPSSSGKSVKCPTVRF
ncbi:MAG: PorP/SprF family type IX secretion system membrane protein [Sphingobacteriia bacterium]|nr:PorP/SprF family type IX secretion system membrane protein [Sphingobacteriia bacterium]